MPLVSVPDSMRRAVVLAALQPDANKAAIAREHGVTREYVSKQAMRAVRAAEEELVEAKEELAFRQRVLELAGGCKAGG